MTIDPCFVGLDLILPCRTRASYHRTSISMIKGFDLSAIVKNYLIAQWACGEMLMELVAFNHNWWVTTMINLSTITSSNTSCIAVLDSISKVPVTSPSRRVLGSSRANIMVAMCCFFQYLMLLSTSYVGTDHVIQQGFLAYQTCCLS